MFVANQIEVHKTHQITTQVSIGIDIPHLKFENQIIFSQVDISQLLKTCDIQIEP